MDEIANDNCGPLFPPIRANSSGKRGRKRPKPRFASVTAAIPSVQLLPSINKGRGRLFHIRDSPKSTGSGTKQIAPIFISNETLVDSITNEYYTNVTLLGQVVFSLIIKDYKKSLLNATLNFGIVG